MRIFIAGATGTLGRPVTRMLVARGLHVVGLTRRHDRSAMLEQMGAQAVVGDALHADTLRSLIVDARPDQVIHLLTALPPSGALRSRHLEATNEVRITGTRNVLRAAIAAGARRLVAESFVGIYGSGQASPSEDDPLPPRGGGPFAKAIDALRILEDELRAARTRGEIETVALRIGLFYGSDTPSTQAMARDARAGRLAIPRRVPGLGPLVHIDDAAAAVVAAVERPQVSAVYNIVDDQPLPLDTFVTMMAEAIGAPAPKRVPGWLIRIAAPIIAELAVARLPLSNAKAKRELGWSLRYPTVREGMVELKHSMAMAA